MAAGINSSCHEQDQTVAGGSRSGARWGSRGVLALDQAGREENQLQLEEVDMVPGGFKRSGSARFGHAGQEKVIRERSLCLISIKFKQHPANKVEKCAHTSAFEPIASCYRPVCLNPLLRESKMLALHAVPRCRLNGQHGHFPKH